jgi:hypothetical protein
MPHDHKRPLFRCSTSKIHPKRLTGEYLERGSHSPGIGPTHRPVPCFPARAGPIPCADRLFRVPLRRIREDQELLTWSSACASADRWCRGRVRRFGSHPTRLLTACQCRLRRDVEPVRPPRHGSRCAHDGGTKRSRRRGGDGWAQHEERPVLASGSSTPPRIAGSSQRRWTLIKTGRTTQHTTPKIRGVSVCGRYSNRRR